MTEASEPETETPNDVSEPETEMLEPETPTETRTTTNTAREKPPGMRPQVAEHTAWPQVARHAAGPQVAKVTMHCRK